VAVEEVRNINPLEVLTYRTLVIVDPTKSVTTLASRIA
jgi:hypothetical protein